MPSTAHVCVDTTGRDASQRNFDTWLLSDGTACGDLPNLGWGPVAGSAVRQVVNTRFAHRFGRVCSVSELHAAVAGIERHAPSTTPIE